MMSFSTVNVLPEAKRVHALFLGFCNGSYGFEVTGYGTVAVPDTAIIRQDNLGVMSKGEDLSLKRYGQCVGIWRTS